MAAFIQDDLISSFEEFIAKGEIFIFAAWCFNYMLVEMLYVCMGFGLYLNSRIEAEGWDIEIVFRNLGEKTKKTGLEPVVFLLCLFLGLFSPAKSFALAGGAGESGAPAELTAPNEAPLEILNSVLQSPDFGGERESWGIRLKKTPLPGKAPDVNFSPWMETLRTIFASMLRLILTALAAGLAVFLFWYFRRYRLKKNAPKDKGITTRVLEQALAESPESLLDKAERFFENGDPRPAWGYCAAAAVRSWSLYRGLAFPPNATEYDCAGMVRSAAMTANGAETAGQEGEARSFGILIGHWVNLAYGGRLPPEGSFREAAAFCRSLGRNNG
jgi:hypothetical protein